MKRCLLWLVCLFISIHSFGQSLETDRLALVAIYNATSTGTNADYGGPNFNDITGWNLLSSPGDSPCGWTGVTCEGGRVTRLDLSLFQVHGPLAPEVGNLSELKYLNIMQGGAEFYPMTGQIPATLGNLQNLEYLEMRGNVFAAANMEVIGSLTKLTHLAFDTPRSWTIPNSYQNLVNLEYLYFDVRGGWSWPELGSVGSIPAYFGNFTKLKTLAMPWAGASGQIPASLGNLTNLEVLDLRHNKLTGQIPASFNNLTKLTLLDLSENRLNSPIPNILGIPVSANVKINDNAFNFSGMETNISRLDSYGNQEEFKLTALIPLRTGALKTARTLGFAWLVAYNAGGTQANNTYKWYKSGVLIATTVGSESIYAEDGIYRVEVTNSLVPGLTLVSENFALVVMPVTLVSFDGKHENNQNRLTWKTTSETNNKGFEIERSADAGHFETIGFVDGNGDTKESHTYQFTDPSPFGMTYYRLKQLDHDGKFEYSKVVAVKSEAAIVKVYPNPAQEHLTISGISQKQPFSIVDQNGRIVIEGMVTNMQQINIRNLGAGRYVVRVGDESSRLLIHR